MDPQIDTAQRRAEMSHCRQCGMLCKIGEYHPYAACMMFSHCRDGDTVRANLSAVQQQTRRAALEEAQWEIEKFIDYSGGCVGTKNDPQVVAVNRFIELTVGPLLARLREGVAGRPRCEQCGSLLIHEPHKSDCLYIKCKPDAREGR